MVLVTVVDCVVFAAAMMSRSMIVPLAVACVCTTPSSTQVLSKAVS